MTDIESQWANRMEWAEEKRRGFDIEIKNISVWYPMYENCTVRRCKKKAKAVYVVGKVSHEGGIEIPLCRDHENEDNAFDIYREEHDGQ